jgi:hypothetical protein
VGLRVSGRIKVGELVGGALVGESVSLLCVGESVFGAREGDGVGASEQLTNQQRSGIQLSHVVISTSGDGAGATVGAHVGSGCVGAFVHSVWVTG